MNLPQQLSSALDGVGAAAKPIDVPGIGRSKPEAREVVGTVQHAHGVVTPGVRSCSTAGPTQPTRGAGAAAPG